MAKIKNIYIPVFLLSAIAFFAVNSASTKDKPIACSDIKNITFRDLAGWVRSNGIEPGILADFNKSKEALEAMLEEIIFSKEPKGIPFFSANDESIKKYYDSNPEVFYRKKQYRLSHILCKDQEELNKATGTLRGFSEKLSPQEAMIKTAEIFSDPSHRWGDLGWISEGKFQEEFDKNVFSLKGTGHYAAFQSPIGFHLVMVMHIRQARAFSLQEARPFIKKALELDYKKNYLKLLKEKYHAGIRENELKKSCLQEEKKENMALIPGGQMYSGFSPEEIDARYKIWEKNVRQKTGQKTPGWLDYIYTTYRKISVKPFYIDKYEVSISQYRESNRTFRQRLILGDDYPVTGINWSQANAYCKWRGKRLPSQDEWEFAARGSARRIYPWGDQEPDGSKGNFADINSPLGWRDNSINDGYAHLAPVNAYQKGATPEGVYNLGGNAREWTSTVDLKKRSAVTKGGSFENAFDDMMSADQRPYGLEETRPSLGFRCACDYNG